jgi:hypothetical protein
MQQTKIEGNLIVKKKGHWVLRYVQIVDNLI